MKFRIVAAVALMLSVACVEVCCAGGRVTVEVASRDTEARKGESVRVEWSRLTDKLNISPANVVVTDAKGAQIPSQVLYEGHAEPQGLLFQADVAPKGKSKYFVAKGRREEYPSRAYGRYVPERLDDYAWENDLIAFRLYGPALTDPVSPGWDIWCKSTRNLIINKWYAGDNYHKNEGEGMDCFKVGVTLGCGACAPIVDGKVVLSGNYATQQNLDNGPIRTTVRLTYAPFEVEGKMVAVEKIISLDAGSHFNMVKERYTGDFAKMTVAAGLVLHENNLVATSERGSIITVEETASDSKEPVRDGNIFMAVVMPRCEPLRADGHLLLTREVAPEEEFTYRAGAGWSQGGIRDGQMWEELARREEAKMNLPLEVSVF